MNKKQWSPEVDLIRVQEDLALKSLVSQMGTEDWKSLVLRLNEMSCMCQRTQKQCKERWLKHLNKNGGKKAWTKNEDKYIFEMHNQFENKWKEIAQHLPARYTARQQRTQNDIKNHFYATIRKGLRRLNKLLDLKKDPALLKNIKPFALSQMFERCTPFDDSRDQLIRVRKAGQNENKIYSRVIDLIILIGRKGLRQFEEEEILEDQELISQAVSFFDALETKNKLYVESKICKQARFSSKPSEEVPSTGVQLDNQFDISAYLFLGDLAKNKPLKEPAIQVEQHSERNSQNQWL